MSLTSVVISLFPQPVGQTDQQYHTDQIKRFRHYDFSGEQKGIAQALALFQHAEIQARDASLLHAELCFTADLMAHAATLGRQRFATPGLSVDEIPSFTRKELAAELEALIQHYRELWLSRSRLGGLKDSTGRMDTLKARYLTE